MTPAPVRNLEALATPAVFREGPRSPERPAVSREARGLPRGPRSPERPAVSREGRARWSGEHDSVGGCGGSAERKGWLAMAGEICRRAGRWRPKPLRRRADACTHARRSRPRRGSTWGSRATPSPSAAACPQSQHRGRLTGVPWRSTSRRCTRSASAWQKSTQPGKCLASNIPLEHLPLQHHDGSRPTC
jgi:hypothetical protein